MLLWIDWRTAPTWDEGAHLASGLYHIQYGEFGPYCVNPPLIRMLAAVPVWAADGGLPWLNLPPTPGFRSEGLLASTLMRAQGKRCFELVAMARMALIPITTFGTFLLWSIGRRFYGVASGWVAAILWCFSPMVLTFSGTIVPDVSAAVFGLLATYRFYIWLRMGTWSSAIFLGIATALALLSKSTWLILPLVFVALWLIDWAKHRQHCFHTYFFQSLGGFAIAWLFIHGTYDFRGVLRPLGDFEFRSRAFTGNDRPYVAGNRFSNSTLGLIRMPLPADYITGIDMQRCDFEAEFPSYFLGTWRDRGWWYYYLAGVFLKEPVAIWGFALLFTLGVFLKLQRRVTWREVVIYTPGVAVLVFVSSQTGFNHHVRYVMPFFPCLYLIASRSAAGDNAYIRVIAIVLCGWYAFSSATILPRSYAFFTEAVGGASEGWRYLGDSNLDWGQDLITIRDWANANPHKRPIWLLYSPDALDFQHLGVDATNGRARILAGRPDATGWWAIFATPMIKPGYEWFRDAPATIRLSPTLKLIYVSPSDLEQLRDGDT